MRKISSTIFDNLGDIARATIFPIDRVSTKRRFVLVYGIRLFFLVGQRLVRDKCLQQAAALSFQTVLSLVPLVAVIAAISAALDFGQYEEKMTGFIEAQLIPEAAQDVSRWINEISAGFRPRPIGIVSGVSLLALSLTLLFNVEQVVNSIFRCRRGRRIYLRIVTGLAVMAIAPLAIGLSLYFTSALTLLSGFGAEMRALLLTIAALFLCYWLLPHRKVRLRFALISAAIAGVGFEAVKIGFAVYARHLGVTLSYLYGTFAILPLFMVWVYVAWVIFLFGAELNASLHEVTHHDRLAR